MALTVAELSAALRITADSNSPPAEPQLGILHRQLVAARAEVTGYASEAREEVQDEAAIRMIGYYYDRPDASNPFILVGRKGDAYPLAWAGVSQGWRCCRCCPCRS